MAQIQVQHQSHVVSGPNGGVAAAGGGGDGANQFVTTSLYVGDLDFNVTDSQLYDLFNQVGQVVSVRVCRDLSTRRSLGYGYVNYSNPQDAARAIEVLNFTPLNDKVIRIMYSHRDPSVRKSGAANIFIKNLDKAIDNKALHDTFSSFGNILSCKIATDHSGQSKGYGKQERDTAMNKTKFNNVYVKNLSESTSEEDLNKIFGEYGILTSVVVMRDGDGKSKCFGFVNFENTDAAANAVEALNGKKIDDKECIDDDKLRELFSEFGTITSCKVMRDPSGISRGSGFVAFTTAEEASRALAEMNGKMVGSKPLYVALASGKKIEEQDKLDSKGLAFCLPFHMYISSTQVQFSQMRPVAMAMAPSLAPRMPMYTPGAPGLGQQLFYGQAPPAIIPPQAGFGYQQQLVPGMRPAGAPMPNFFMPMVQQGQQGQRPGGRRGAGPVQQGQQPLPLMQQQMFPRGRVYRYPAGRNMQDVPMPGVAGGMLSVPYDMGGMLSRDTAVGQPMAVPALATSLANAPPDQQRTHEHAAKVTGMLLEMDQTEVLHLLESPEALRAKVKEAMDVLRNVSQQHGNSPADQLASLSLNDNLS
ncbi:poly(A) binding protein 2 [Actinidia rufa]|uniref:Poly(A) binding protein 2 n=1 Tax=Actinidia rufa TaxID=165716 RepID=A0A7J0DH94_9ERIC|nr:poly(A) binding protein 2 [Actinidia rufa]